MRGSTVCTLFLVFHFGLRLVWKVFRYGVSKTGGLLNKVGVTSGCG